MKKLFGLSLLETAARLVVVRASVYRVLSTSADGGSELAGGYMTIGRIRLSRAPPLKWLA
jgi:hypothetical protein